MTRTARLAAYLTWAGDQPLDYGTWDCLIGLVAEWVKRERGYDPATPWRGRYRTALGCARLIRREGGVAAIMTRGAEALIPTDRPRAGDVGLIRYATTHGEQPMGAICTGRAWAVLVPGGFTLVPTQPLMAWTV